MKVSELVNILNDFIVVYGDLDVIFEDQYSDFKSEVLDVLIEFTPSKDSFKLTNYYHYD